MSRRSVVVLMPFAPGFLPVYDQAIKPACSAAGVECIRVDEQLFGENVMQRLYHDIDSADIVVADMTGCNVNVFYEVGYAHGRKKDVILLTRNANDIPYDLKQYQTVVYDEDLHVLKQRLQRWLEHYATNPTRRVREIRTVFGPAAVDETEGVTVTIPVFHPASHDDYVEAESWVWKVYRPYQGPERRSRRPLYSPVFVLEDSLAYEEFKTLFVDEGLRAPRFARDDVDDSNLEKNKCLVCVGGPRSNFMTEEILRIDECARFVGCEHPDEATLKDYCFRLHAPRRATLKTLPNRALGVVLRAMNPCNSENAVFAVWGDRAESTLAAARFVRRQLPMLAEVVTDKPLLALLGVWGNRFEQERLIYLARPDREIEVVEEDLARYVVESK